MTMTRIPSCRGSARTRLRWLLVGIGATAGTAALLGASSGPSSAAAASAKPTPAERAFADAVNLRLADLPGFHRASHGGVTVGGDPNAQFKHCFGHRATDSDGPSVESAGFALRSGADAVAAGSLVGFPSKAELDRDEAELSSDRFPRCVADGIAAAKYTVQGVTISGSAPRATVLPAAVQRSGTVDPVLSMRAHWTWKVRTVRLPVYLDFYAVAVGQYEIALFVFSTGLPVQLDFESKLVALLVSRATAQSASAAPA